MKTLSIKQPWAFLIASGQKDIENRTWQTAHRGMFFIHASKGFDKKGYEWVQDNLVVQMPAINDFLLGGIIGKAFITDVVTSSNSPWFFGPFGFKLSHAELIHFYPMKGQLGFFDTTPNQIKNKEMCWQLIVDGKVLNTITDTIFREQYKRLKTIKGITFMPVSPKEAETNTPIIPTVAQKLHKQRRQAVPATQLQLSL